MTTSGRVDVIAWRWLAALSNALRVARSSMSPTWADSQTYRSAPTENVFFRSPPTARAGTTSTGKANGMGAKPRDRVVARHVNAPVVSEPGISDAAEAVECIGIVGDDRLAGQVATRHHQHLRARRVSGKAEQQVVYRRIGDHDADV